jgi:hypothetical protein
MLMRAWHGTGAPAICCKIARRPNQAKQKLSPRNPSLRKESQGKQLHAYGKRPPSHTKIKFSYPFAGFVVPFPPALAGTLEFSVFNHSELSNTTLKPNQTNSNTQVHDTDALSPDYCSPVTFYHALATVVWNSMVYTAYLPCLIFYKRKPLHFLHSCAGLAISIHHMVVCLCLCFLYAINAMWFPNFILGKYIFSSFESYG